MMDLISLMLSAEALWGNNLRNSCFPHDASHPRGVLGLIFTGYVPLASQSPYPIIVYFLANYGPLVTFWKM